MRGHRRRDGRWPDKTKALSHARCARNARRDDATSATERVNVRHGAEDKGRRTKERHDLTVTFGRQGHVDWRVLCSTPHLVRNFDSGSVNLYECFRVAKVVICYTFLNIANGFKLSEDDLD